jgi:transposase
MIIKTDRKDARGIAQLLRMGWYRSVHSKSPGSQDVRALLTGRKLLQAKLRDVELSIRGILRGYGLKVGEVSRGRFEERILELVDGHPVLETVIGAMLHARHALWNEFTKMHREMLKIVRQDRVCQRLMTTPGVGALVAITYRSAVDDPGRFAKSQTVGAYFGLTPKKYQSGETDLDGGISRVGDTMVRTALYEAAHIMLTRATRFSALKRWAVDVAKRRGMKRAKVALARKLATILHRITQDAPPRALVTPCPNLDFRIGYGEPIPSLAMRLSEHGGKRDRRMSAEGNFRLGRELPDLPGPFAARIRGYRLRISNLGSHRLHLRRGGELVCQHYASGISAGPILRERRYPVNMHFVASVSFPASALPRTGERFQGA